MCLITQVAAVRNTIREEMGTYRTSPVGPTVCQAPPEFPWKNLVTRVKSLLSSSSHREEMWLRSSLLERPVGRK